MTQHESRDDTADETVELTLKDVHWARRWRVRAQYRDHETLTVSLTGSVLAYPEKVGHVTVLKSGRDHFVYWLDRKLSHWSAHLSFRRKFRVWKPLRPVAYLWSRPIERLLRALDDWLLRRYPLRFKRWEADIIVGDLRRLNLPPDMKMIPLFMDLPKEGLVDDLEGVALDENGAEARAV